MTSEIFAAQFNVQYCIDIDIHTPPPRAGESPLAVPNEVTRRGAAMPGDRQPAQRGTSSSAASKAPRVRPLGLRPPEPPVSFPRRARRAHMALFVTLAQVAAGAPAPELPALYMTVSPTSVLHLSPSSPETTLAICKAHDNIRHDYFRAMCARNKEQSSGWVLLDNAAWVENTTLGVLIAVTGPTALFQNRSAICTAAALSQEAMPFNSLDTVKKLLQKVPSRPRVLRAHRARHRSRARSARTARGSVHCARRDVARRAPVRQSDSGLRQGSDNTLTVSDSPTVRQSDSMTVSDSV